MHIKIDPCILEYALHTTTTTHDRCLQEKIN